MPTYGFDEYKNRVLVTTSGDVDALIKTALTPINSSINTLRVNQNSTTADLSAYKVRNDSQIAALQKFDKDLVSTRLTFDESIKAFGTDSILSWSPCYVEFTGSVHFENGRSTQTINLNEYSNGWPMKDSDAVYILPVAASDVLKPTTIVVTNSATIAKFTYDIYTFTDPNFTGNMNMRIMFLLPGQRMFMWSRT